MQSRTPRGKGGGEGGSKGGVGRTLAWSAVLALLRSVVVFTPVHARMRVCKAPHA